jgi:hypothetical protein
MKRQATGAHSVKHMVNDRLAGQQGLQFVHAATRCGKSLTTTGGQNNKDRKALHGRDTREG